LSREVLTSQNVDRQVSQRGFPAHAGPVSPAVHSDCPTLDMLRLDDAARALRYSWAYHPESGRPLAPWENLGEPTRETWRKAATATILAYGV
jgi:hypothetical protein